MNTTRIQPVRGRRRFRRLLLMPFVLLLGVGVVILAVMHGRISLATRIARGALDRAGFGDATFSFARVSPGCVIIENVRLGGTDPAVAVDRVEARFVLPDVFGGRIDQLRIRGVHLPAVLDDDLRLKIPLLERLQPFLQAKGAAAVDRVDQGSGAMPVIGELSVYDLRLPLRLAGGADIATVNGELTLLVEPDAPGEPGRGRYRVAVRVGDGVCVEARCDGVITPDIGALSLRGELDVRDTSRLLSLARLIAPGRISVVPVELANCNATVRGSVSLIGWTNVGPFAVTAELGRGSALSVTKPEAFARIQTFRAEASGTPETAEARCSIGLSALRWGGQIQLSQEEGSLAEIRGMARAWMTPSGRVARVSLDSELPGRTVIKALSAMLPRGPPLLNEGITLHAEAEMSQSAANKTWSGVADFSAEARRTAVRLPSGQAGFDSAVLKGNVPIDRSRLGAIRTEVLIEDGTFLGSGVSARGGGNLAVVSTVPYHSAAGIFDAQFTESKATARAGLSIERGVFHFAGEIVASGLNSNPVCCLNVRMPAVGLSGRAGPADWRASAAASARLRYGVEGVELEGDARLSRLALDMAVSNALGRVEAGIENLDAHFMLPRVVPATLGDAAWRATVVASNGWARAGKLVALEDARLAAPLVWSVKEGLLFGEAPALSWRAFDVGGLRLQPVAATLHGGRDSIEGRIDGSVEGSALKLAASLRLPFADPLQCEIGMDVLESRLAEDDALFAAVRKFDREVSLSGLVSAQTRLRFPSKQPQVTGVARLSDMTVKKGALEVKGLQAEIPFVSDTAFRTRGRPYIAFVSAQAGNLRTDKGRLAFQVTPEELFVDRFEVGWCKGSLNAYSVHLDLKKMKSDVVIYADRIDLGEVLQMVIPFKGRAEGVLYGRFPLGIERSRVALSTGFLYSLPGQGGQLRMEDHAPMQAMLGLAGVHGDIQTPLAKALSDVDFRSIRMELEPKTGGDAVFRVKLDGKSNYAEWSAPVDLNLNLHGPLEELVNFGLGVSRNR